jgi:hypothetical protein
MNISFIGSQQIVCLPIREWLTTILDNKVKAKVELNMISRKSKSNILDLIASIQLPFLGDIKAEKDIRYNNEKYTLSCTNVQKRFI